MTSPIRTERHDNVLVVISDNPPVNALGVALRGAVHAAHQTLQFGEFADHAGGQIGL